MVVIAEARQRDLHLAGELQTHHTMEAFSEETIDVVFHLISPEATRGELLLDLFQVGGELAAPVIQDQRPEAIRDGEVVTEARFSVSAPNVEETVAYLARLKTRSPGAETWRKVGLATIVVHPSLNWEKLQNPVDKVVVWSKEEGPVTRFLRDAGLTIHSPGALELREQKALVIWEVEVIDEDHPELATRGQEILLFRPVEAGDGLPRIEYRFAGAGAILDILLGVRLNIDTVQGQITLYRILETALARHLAIQTAQSFEHNGSDITSGKK